MIKVSLDAPTLEHIRAYAKLFVDEGMGTHRRVRRKRDEAPMLDSSLKPDYRNRCVWVSFKNERGMGQRHKLACDFQSEEEVDSVKQQLYQFLRENHHVQCDRTGWRLAADVNHNVLGEDGEEEYEEDDEDDEPEDEADDGVH